MTLADRVSQQLLQGLSRESLDMNASLNDSLRLLSKWRSVLIQNTLLEKEGTRVLGGPLKGLDFIDKSAEGCHIAKLLGCYEQPLQQYINRVLNGNYTKIINIGCAEGYYAVGFARLIPSIISLAFDTDPKAQEACKLLAKKNGVTDRVIVGGKFGTQDFAKFEKEEALVFCDIEGGEKELLDPEVAPALRKLDIIVESHECLCAGITQTLLSRFKSTHDIEIVEDHGSRQLENPPSWFSQLAHLDQLLAIWEWRSGPTPWLVMRSKSA
jgi:hypothetical protein